VGGPEGKQSFLRGKI